MEVIILCGGLGTRLQPVLPEIPKCLAPTGPQPFLGWLLKWLERFPLSHVVFSVGHLKGQVMAYVQSREWPFDYDFAVEETPLGTGGGIRLALRLCRENEVFVINGDTFFPVNLAAMPFNAPVTLALKPMRDFERYGAVSVTADGMGLTISAFHEKAPCKEGLINGGVYAIDRSRLNLRDLPEKFSFEKDVLEPLAASGEIGGWVSGAFFIDIGIPEDYRKAQWALPAWFAVQKASAAVLEAEEADTLFLDRDGVLNRHLEGDYVKKPEEWEWMPGMREALAAWARKFSRIVLVTNQRGVGRGLMTDRDLALVHKRMLEEIGESGGRLDLILVCTATDDADPRRKPNIGMFHEACALLPGIEAQHSILVGDSEGDALFAARCGMRFILLEAVS